jgi:hypothetical protein
MIPLSLSSPVRERFVTAGSVTDTDRRECATELFPARIAESWVVIVQTKYVGVH